MREKYCKQRNTTRFQHIFVASVRQAHSETPPDVILARSRTARGPFSATVATGGSRRFCWGSPSRTSSEPIRTYKVVQRDRGAFIPILDSPDIRQHKYY